MLKSLLKYHIIPFLIAFCLVLVGIEVYSRYLKNKEIKTVVITGTQQQQRSFYPNLSGGDSVEIDYMAGLINPDQITVFGSSEFTDLPYVSYNFLPDSLGIPCMGVGHAYHQELSIFCELLAGYEYLENSKVCVILSPAWFETEGTNVPAFLEFVQPNFLKRICSNGEIPETYKKYIGEYIDRNYDQISAPSKEMEYLKELFLDDSRSRLDEMKYTVRKELMPVPNRKLIEYRVTTSKGASYTGWNQDFDSLKQRVQQDFLATIKKNKLFVEDEYYTTYVLDEQGKELSVEVPDIDMDNCQELKDLKMLLDLLKRKKVQASFVMQPQNPYFYTKLERNKDLVETVEGLVQDAGFPFLNMYVVDKKSYQPGTLKDVMHLGNYGWLSIDRFLLDVYYE